jgi:acyl-coenzyme A thioesterase PaaI-like protein
MNANPSSLYENSGQLVIATDLARGPWDPRFLHGGPVSALLAGAIEAASTIGAQEDASAMHVARCTIELERPIPAHTPMRLVTEITRPGRKVQLVDTRLLVDDSVVARARGMRIRKADIALPDSEVAKPENPPAPPSSGRSEKPNDIATYGAFHNTANEIRFIDGSWLERGPATVWVRLLVPVLPGMALTPLQRVAAAADFGNGFSSVLSPDSYTYINPDLTIHTHRSLVGEWVGMQSKMHLSESGVGFAESAVFDQLGRLGRSVQSLLIDQRPA